MLAKSQAEKISKKKKKSSSSDEDSSDDDKAPNKKEPLKVSKPVALNNSVKAVGKAKNESSTEDSSSDDSSDEDATKTVKKPIAVIKNAAPKVAAAVPGYTLALLKFFKQISFLFTRS